MKHLRYDALRELAEAGREIEDSELHLTPCQRLHLLLLASIANSLAQIAGHE